MNNKHRLTIWGLALLAMMGLLTSCGGGGGGGGGITYDVPELMYYQFDEVGTSVTNLASAPVGSNPATIEGAMTQGSSGQFGGGLIGTGGSSSTDRLNTGWATALNNDSWTISLYLNNVTSVAAAGLNYIFGDSASGSFRSFVGGVAGADNLMLRGSGLVDVTVTGAAVGTAAVIHFVYDASVPEIRAYLNGVLNTTVAQAAPLTIAGTGPFLIGGYNISSGLPAAGILDEFRMYNRALPATEITATWNSKLPK